MWPATEGRKMQAIREDKIAPSGAARWLSRQTASLLRVSTPKMMDMSTCRAEEEAAAELKPARGRTFYIFMSNSNPILSHPTWKLRLKKEGHVSPPVMVILRSCSKGK